MFSRIVVPLDGSSLAERAILFARSIADLSDGRLRLVRVHVPPRIPATCHQVLGPRAGGELKRSREEARKRDEHYLAETGTRAMSGGGADVSTALLRGPVGHSVVDDARRWDASLVVVSAPVPGVDPTQAIDGETDMVVRRCPAPVLLARHPGNAEPEEGIDVRHVLIPVDGSRRSEAVLEPAAELASLFGAEVTVVRGMRRESEADAATVEAYLEEKAEELRGRGLHADHAALRGDPAESILREAEERGSDVICMASRCRGPLTRMVLGSVADQVLRRAKASILVVSPGK